MKLSDEAIREYIDLYRQDFGEELSFERGREIATHLVTLYEMLARPLPREFSKPPSPPAEAQTSDADT